MITIKGYVIKSTYHDMPRYLSGKRWVDDIMKLKLSDISFTPREIDMKKWPKMADQKYENLGLSIEIL